MIKRYTEFVKLIKESISGKVRVRFAPSPTGGLHIGGLRTALYNYLFAKKNGGDFILRIEDTDRTRFVPAAENYITESLKWLGIEPDESPSKGGPYGPYKQSEREYKKYVFELVDKDMAYIAFDSSDELTEMRGDSGKPYNYDTRTKMINSFTLSKEEVEDRMGRGEPYVVRFNSPRNKSVTFSDILRGNITINSDQVDDKVLLKADGIPTYHMANVIDDHLMEISHVIRGEEWIPSTPLHVMLYEAFGWEAPKYAHLSLLLNPVGKGKLSKRMANKLGFPIYPLTWEGEIGYKESGYLPEALLNFLATLGWAQSDDKDIIGLDELISRFDIKKLSRAGIKFDTDKLKWMNSQYLNKIPNSELIKEIDTHGNEGHFTKEEIDEIINMSKARATFIEDMQVISDIFFGEVNLSKTDLSKFKRKEFNIVFKEFVNRIDEIEKWEANDIKNFIYNISVEKQIKFGAIMPSLRMILVGGIPGPDLAITMEILGKDLTANRINNGLNLK